MNLRLAVYGEEEVRLAPGEILALIARLPEGSRFVAELRDGEFWREFLDVGPDHYVLAGIYNAVNDNTRATGNWKKPPRIEPWPIPQLAVKRAREERDRKPRTVAELFGAFSRNAHRLPEGLKKE